MSWPMLVASMPRPTGVSGWVYAGNIQYSYQNSYAPVITWGPVIGIAITGFVLGIMFDLSVGSPLGSSAIVMGIAGYVAGQPPAIMHGAGLCAARLREPLPVATCIARWVLRRPQYPCKALSP